MAPSTAYTRASTILISSSTSSIRRSLAVSRVHRYRNVPARSLWWWGRHGTWSAATDESLEERMQRHQKIMRHRYSRALRRRAMWDRDDNPSSLLYRVSDGRLGRRWGTCRSMTSTDSTTDRLHERQIDPSRGEPHWAAMQDASKAYDRHFEAFKDAVDRAVERDPYETLFGRRMQSPPTENNASWISWLFAREETPQQMTSKSGNEASRRKIEIEVLDKQATSRSPRSSDAAKMSETTGATPKDIKLQTEYIYDPISGRKVLKPSTVAEAVPQPRQSFLEVLFSEHGNSTPDQVHKHQKVYDRASPKALESEKEGNTVAAETAFENSRKHEYQQLRAATLGNHIDTTAEFGGKLEQESSSGVSLSQEKMRSMPEPSDDAPLFSGTTYESKSIDAASTSRNRPISWLVKEGFQTKGSSTTKPQQKADSLENRLEPSFDRMQSTSEANSGRKFTSKLQPAIDRVQRIKPSEPPRSVSKPFDVTSPSSPAKPLHPAISSLSSSRNDMKEDVDLLRASDVRAATKSARTTKQDMVQAKNVERNKLEDEYNELQQRESEEPISDASRLRANSDRLSRSIESVQRHAEQYSDGIVARTLRSIGISSDSQNPVVRSSVFDVANTFKDLEKSTSNSAEETRRSDEEEATKAKRWESLRQSKKNMEEIRKREDREFAKLAVGIRQIYEAESGPIDLSLAQSSKLGQTKPTAMMAALPRAKDDTSLTKHQSPAMSLEFFAERARFLREVNQVAENVAIIKSKTAQLEVDIDNKSIDSSEITMQAEKLTAEAQRIAIETSVLEAEADKLISQDATKSQHPHPLSVATVKSGVPTYPKIERHTKVFEPRYIQILYAVKSVRSQLQEVSASVHDLKRSRTHLSTEKAGPAVQEPASPKVLETNLESVQKEQASAPTSPYLILVYNKATGEVDQTSMDRLPWAQNVTAEKANPIKIMGSLNYPAAFVTHFVQLEKAGYELSSGGGDMLVFQKKTIFAADTTPSNTVRGALPLKPATRTFRNTIAAAEASAQPEITETIAQPQNTTPRQAATVLDDIPVGIPPPGPAAPTAPPPSSQIKRTPKSGPKVKRQEQVFSGTLPLRPGKTPFQQRSQNQANKSSHESTEGSNDPGFFSRTARTVKRGVLGVAAFGATAYMIGAVAEGIGAQAQVDGDTTLGPRTKVVMPVGQRAGIYSTESSRD